MHNSRMLHGGLHGTGHMTRAHTHTDTLTRARAHESTPYAPPIPPQANDGVIVALSLCSCVQNQLGWASGWMWSDVAASVIQAVLCCWIVYLIRTGDLMSVGPGQQPGQVHPV